MAEGLAQNQEGMLVVGQLVELSSERSSHLIDLIGSWARLERAGSLGLCFVGIS